MLTKTDLSQIRKIVREEVETEVKDAKEDIEGEVKLSRMELQRDIKSLRDKIKDIERSIKTIVNFFDKEHLQLRRRVEKVEEHLGL